ncbi:MAG: BatD family protein, partial [Chloroflexi bacterium]|nr:BatD family protein [Chloroflexota bacterium]
GQDYFVEAEIDNPSPRLGEQVIYTFRFYSAVSFFGRTDYDGPELTGFWSRDDPDQRRYRTVAAGRSYTVAEIRTVLFPTIVGPRTIESAELTIPGGFFQQTTRLKTPPVEMEIQPLPPGALPDFSGAVGRFSITAQIDGTTGVVNEPLLLTVTLSGEGNIDVLPNPILPDMPGWRTVDVPATTNSRIVDDKLVGTRVYERTLVPREPGTLSIPAISYTYFNPAVDRYLRVSTEPIPVTVFRGPAQDAVQALPGVDRDEVERLATDIRHIKPAPAKLRTVGSSLPDRGSFWAVMGFPAVLLAGATLWRGRRRIFGDGTGLTRNARAHGNARTALEAARDTGSDPYAAVGITLTQYIGDKVDQPASGKTHETLIRLLRSRGIEPGLIERVEACLTTSEGGRFAPSVNGITSGDELMAEAASILLELERQFDSGA